MMKDSGHCARNPALRRHAPAVALIAVLCGCGGTGADTPARGGEATGAVRVFDAPVAAVEPLLLMGIGAAGDTSRLGAVAHATFTADGGFVVLDTAALLVRGFSRLGQSSFTVGGAGVGPGLFERMAAVAVSGDTVFVFDDRLWRITAFDLAGLLISTRRVEPRASAVGPAGAGRGSDGRWVHAAESIGEAATTAAATPSVVRAIAVLARWSAAQDNWSTVAELPGTEVYLAGDSGGVPVYRRAPFARGPLWAADGQGGFWYADSDAYSLIRITAAGDTATRVAYAATAPRVSEVDRREWIVDGGRIEASSAEARMRAALPVPDRRPALLALLASPDGEPWIALDTGARDTLEWHALDLFGGPRRRVPLPRRVRILDVRGDTLLLAGQDARGVAFAGRFVLSAASVGPAARRAGTVAPGPVAVHLLRPSHRSGASTRAAHAHPAGAATRPTIGDV